MVIRLGGDEFAIVLPSADARVAEQVLARVRAALEADAAASPDAPLSLSLGGSTLRHGETLHDAFRRADERMYAEKARRIRMRPSQPGNPGTTLR